MAAVQNKEIASTEISAFTARQLTSLNDEKVNKLLGEIWGTVRKTSGYKKKLIEKFCKKLADDQLANASPRRGRLVYKDTCMKCHRLYGEGGKIGPDLTGSNRANLDYFLHNVIDPSAAIAKDYQMNVVILFDGRVLNGIVLEKTGTALVLQTANEKLVISLDDIDEVNRSKLSMMPDGQIEKMTDQQVRDLVVYLRTKQQVEYPDSEIPKQP